MNILDVFYNHIVPEATNGRIDCLNYYNIIFSTNIMEDNKEHVASCDNPDVMIPTLIIKNKSEFNRLLIEYVNKAKMFYNYGDFDSEIINYTDLNNEKMICIEKVILALLFANATVEDFNNPCAFLRKRIEFIDNDMCNYYQFGYSDILSGNIDMQISKDSFINETPYQMTFSVTSLEGDSYVFPKIKFGVSDDTVYIYAIQHKEPEKTTFNKKINRILYKVGEGYNENEEYSEERLKDVTSSFLVSLNMCIAYLYSCGYRKVVVPSILIERWNAKCISNSLKIKHKKLDDVGVKDLLDKHVNIQYNLTNKLIRTFLRLGCHFNNIDVISFPYESDSCLHIELNDTELNCNNRLLFETYQLVADNNIKNKYRK